MCAHMCIGSCRSMHVEVSGQLPEISSLFPWCGVGSWALNFRFSGNFLSWLSRLPSPVFCDWKDRKCLAGSGVGWKNGCRDEGWAD